MNYECGNILKSAYDCQSHDTNCKFRQKCQHCTKIYKTELGIRGHVCPALVPSPGEEEGLEGNREETAPVRAKRKRKSVNLAGLDGNEEAEEGNSDDVYQPDDDMMNPTPPPKSTPQKKTNAKSIPSTTEAHEADVFKSNISRFLLKKKKVSLTKKHVVFRVDYERHEKMRRWFMDNSSEICYPEFKVDEKKITYLSRGEASTYLPTNNVSPSVSYSYLTKNGTRTTLDPAQLNLFEVWSAEKASSTATLFVGGPIHAIEWCPNQNGEEEFLAVSANLSHSQIHSPVTCENAAGLIQIWRSTKETDTSDPWQFSFGIAHDWGPMYNFKWCPTGGRSNCFETGNRLGCLALACADGLVRIISVPHPNLLSSSGTPPTVVRLPAAFILSPRASHLSDRSPHLSKAWCVDWDRSKDHKYIAAGYADGTVAVYKIYDPSSLLLDKNRDVLPVKKIQAHESYVSDLSFDPCNPRYLATVSWDKHLKIFDLRATEVPLYVHKRGAFRSVEWPVTRSGLFFSEDESFNNVPASARFLDFQVSLSRESASLQQHSMTTTHNSSVMDSSYSDWLDAVITCCSGGEVSLRLFMNNVIRYPIPVYRLTDASEEQSPNVQQTSFVDASELTTPSKLQRVRNELFDRLASSIADNDTMITNGSYVYRDCNQFEFGPHIGPMVADVQRSRTHNSMGTTPLSLCLPLSTNVVSWHPSFLSRTLLASGGNLGLVRIHKLHAWGD